MSCVHNWMMWWVAALNFLAYGVAYWLGRCHGRETEPEIDFSVWERGEIPTGQRITHRAGLPASFKR